MDTGARRGKGGLSLALETAKCLTATFLDSVPSFLSSCIQNTRIPFLLLPTEASVSNAAVLANLLWRTRVVWKSPRVRRKDDYVVGQRETQLPSLHEPRAGVLLSVCQASLASFNTMQNGRDSICMKTSPLRMSSDVLLIYLHVSLRKKQRQTSYGGRQ